MDINKETIEIDGVQVTLYEKFFPKDGKDFQDDSHTLGWKGEINGKDYGAYVVIGNTQLPPADLEEHKELLIQHAQESIENIKKL